jgi:hypothetical protein
MWVSYCINSVVGINLLKTHLKGVRDGVLYFYESLNISCVIQPILKYCNLK